MRREHAQLLRLVLICAAWAIGQMLTLGIALQGFDLIIPAGLAIGVYVATDDLGRAGIGRRGDNVRYWRGRPVDDDKRDRWN